MSYSTLSLVAAVVVFALYKLLSSTDKPKIAGIPEIPGVPVFGNLLQLGEEHAKVAAGWAKKYGPVFQARLGNKRVVFVNSFDAVRHFWVTNQSSLISRPTFHTFHNVVSSSQGFTIGTSPWDESCKQRRKAAATALNRPAVQSYMPIIDLESYTAIKELLKDSNNGLKDVDPHNYFAKYALNTSLTLNYGIRIDGGIDDGMLNEIVHVEREVGTLRSTSNNWQDYVPLMRLLPGGKNSTAKEYRQRRDVYLTDLLGRLKKNIANGTDKPCITGNILKDPEAKLNDAEIKSICLTMVSAGLDTVPGNLYMGLGYLSSPHGQEIQERAYHEIMKAYPDGDAWEKCLVEEKVPYITALVKEILRFWTVIPICLPRTSIRDIEWEGKVIPAGTFFLMNAFAADYDPKQFKDPETFNPDRYMVPSTQTPHYSYGAGSRMCAGSHLANRELYTAFLRLISAFRIAPALGADELEKQKGKQGVFREGVDPVLDCLEANAIKTSLTMEPKRFKVRFLARDEEKLKGWLGECEERTKDL